MEKEAFLMSIQDIADKHEKLRMLQSSRDSLLEIVKMIITKRSLAGHRSMNLSKTESVFIADHGVNVEMEYVVASLREEGFDIEDLPNNKLNIKW